MSAETSRPHSGSRSGYKISFRPHRGRRVVTRITSRELRNQFHRMGGLELPVELKSSQSSIELKIPARATLERSHRWGWRKIWQGQEVAAADEIFELKLDASSSWRVCTPLASLSIEPTFEVSRATLLESMQGFWDELRSRWVATSMIAHALVFALMGASGWLSHGGLPALLQKLTHSAPAQIQPPSSLAHQETIAVSTESSSDFQGVSLAQFLARRESRITQPEDLAKKMQSVSDLLKKGLFTATGKNQPSPKDAGKLSASNGSPYKNLQAGIAASQGSNSNASPGSAATGSAGPRISWRPELASTEKSAGSRLTEGQQQKILQTFSRFQDHFRGCYENALLQDEELSVTVAFETEVGAGGHLKTPKYSVSGKSKPDSKAALLRCLNQVMEQAQLGQGLDGVKIRNQFIFNS